ncbi:hypothetical protein BD293_3614 [Roseinatronobacter monicus]|uniref:Uncharacterized protein n=1 Tax=Roseinatronobacter monicus TaxID=393481 RepID=A0A543KIP0_9RHOB|nr:hypothetical protein BD293_3614 [Roseinatronobacter monicus]
MWVGVVELRVRGMLSLGSPAGTPGVRQIEWRAGGTVIEVLADAPNISATITEESLVADCGFENVSNLTLYASILGRVLSRDIFTKSLAPG